ncbi:Xanthotoxin 5-hydroxylase CYP82C4 [Sesamum alatum]|uniref:Flavonoid-6-hydroxylase n=1 Tax=Sesamum alatum TaxID=300844 RepID=A0AAE1YV97_9LAMI|nr:Xanthotoxin 5-hydroxylase CYP82C4 [Sesamum alatum]
MDLILVQVGAIVSGLLFLALLYNLWRKDSHSSKNVDYGSSPPQPRGAWPIIGHLHLLSGKNHIAQALGSLADKYGPVFTLRLGLQRAVVVSSREVVMECYTTNDKGFANRPKSSAGEHLVYAHKQFGFNDSPCWGEMRKLISLEVLSSSSLKAIKKLGVSETITTVRRLYYETRRVRPSKVVISHWIEEMTSNIVVKMIVGKRYENAAEAMEVERLRSIIREVACLSGQFVVSDVIPIPLLRWMDLQGHIKGMKQVSKELDDVIEDRIDECMKRRVMKGEKGEEQDLMDEVLSIVDDKFLIDAARRRAIIKTLVVNIILGIFDTTSVYLTRLISVLTDHRQVMQRAQAEIDTKVGKQRWVQESDLNSLLYLQATMKETLRLYPPLPLSLPHEAAQECRVAGYPIPRGTQLFVNLWKLHRDPGFWPEPERFLPERFLMTGHAHARAMDVTGQQFEFVPFGCGRRSCPGITFAMELTSFTLARLVQGFDFGALVEVNGDSVAVERQNPLEVLVSPRLSGQLYEQL